MSASKTIGLVIAAFFAAAGLFAGLVVAGEGETPPQPGSDGFATYVLDKIDDIYRGTRSHGVMEMKIKTSHWSRTMVAETWSLGKRYSIVRILQPLKEKGSATLKADQDLFMYLNKTGRTIKISSGMMGSSWMGSHFSNDDLVKGSRMSEDYSVEASVEKESGGVNICNLTLIPREGAPVVWGKVEVSVRQSDLQPISQRFYDEDGREVRELKFTDHRQIGDRMMPMKMTMRPLDGSGEYTSITWKKIDFDVKLDKGFFSLQRLKSMR